MIGLSQAYMLSGELDEGARLGHEALAAAGNTSSDRVQVLLKDFHRDTAQHARTISVRELRARVSETLTVRGMT
jgi:hypothetical protein